MIRVTPAGVGGYVHDFVRGNTITELDPRLVRVRGRTARVTVPPALLPGSDEAPGLRFSAWSRSRLIHGVADIDDFVASFLPEDGTVPVRRAGRAR